ncbi:MAG: dipeptidase [Hydrogenibacillus sp.]|nr:dipeptidase [Hydrogenibacillus sp.]
MRFADAHVDVLYQLWRAGEIAALADRQMPAPRALFEEQIANDLPGVALPMHVTRPKLAQGAVKLLFTAVFVPPAAHDRSTAAALQMIDLFYTAIAGCDLMPVRTAAEFERAEREGKTALVLTLEGAEPVGRDLSRLRTFARLGVRLVGPTHNPANAVADGVGEARGGGLTAFGAAFIDELARLGLGLDVAHLGERAFWQALEHYPHPIVATHANAKAVYDHRRNLSDDQIRALARSGGLIGVTFVPAFLTDRHPATIDDLLLHIEHILSLVGEDHLAIGSDFDGIEETPAELPHIGALPVLFDALAKRYPARVVDKISYDNWARYLRRLLIAFDHRPF